MAQMLKRQRPPRIGATVHKMRIPSTIDNRARLSATEGGFGDGFSCRIFPSEGVLGEMARSRRIMKLLGHCLMVQVSVG